MEATRDPDKFISSYLFPKIESFLGKTLGKHYTDASPADKAVYEQITAPSSRADPGRQGNGRAASKTLIDRDVKAGMRSPNSTSTPC